MTQGRKRNTLALATALTLAGVAAMLVAAPAEARHVRRVVPRVAIGIGFYPGFYAGFHPYLGAYPYAPVLVPRVEGGLQRGVARALGLGAIDLDVKPRKAEVWVDGAYAGKVGDFDGYPSFLWLEKGTHRVAIYRDGYQTWEDDIRVTPGMRVNLKFELARGPSRLPSGAR